jgi:hypothetical protein
LELNHCWMVQGNRWLRVGSQQNNRKAVTKDLLARDHCFGRSIREATSLSEGRHAQGPRNPNPGAHPPRKGNLLEGWVCSVVCVEVAHSHCALQEQCTSTVILHEAAERTESREAVPMVGAEPLSWGRDRLQRRGSVHDTRQQVVSLAQPSIVAS